MILCTINETLSNLINSEGAILRLFREKESGSIFVRGLTAPGNTEIFCRTNSVILELYLRSRINLIELFQLRADDHYIIHNNGQAEARFLEITSEQEPAELNSLRCGTDLFHLLPRNMRTDKRVATLIEMLPSPNEENGSMELEELARGKMGPELFNVEQAPFRIVTIANEELNEDEHDFIEGTTQNGCEIILTKTNPMALKLYLTGRLTINELFRLRQCDHYYIISDNNIVRTGFTNEVNSLIGNLNYTDKTYFNLPAEIQVDDPLVLWKNYQDKETINGKGILYPDFENQYPIGLTIEEGCP